MRLIALCRLFHQKEFPVTLTSSTRISAFMTLLFVLLPAFDKLHPNRLGYLAMGMAIDLDLLMK
jgi:hypothetical protein